MKITLYIVPLLFSFLPIIIRKITTMFTYIVPMVIVIRMSTIITFIIIHQTTRLSLTRMTGEPLDTTPQSFTNIKQTFMYITSPTISIFLTITIWIKSLTSITQFSRPRISTLAILITPLTPPYNYSFNLLDNYLETGLPQRIYG